MRVDLRYTPTTCFETYPWPTPTPVQRERIGGLAARLVAERQTITMAEEIGLTALYNAVDEGAWRCVSKLHYELDKAVLNAYGWPTSLRDDPLELKLRLAERHAAIRAGDIPYDPFPIADPIEKDANFT